jgi:glycosyltransferase XagB
LSQHRRNKFAGSRRTVANVERLQTLDIQSRKIHQRTSAYFGKQKYKGWMQTWLVHTRHPRRLWHDLGGARFVGLQVFMGGVLLSVLVYPIACLSIALNFAMNGTSGDVVGWTGSWIWQIAGGSLVAGLGISVLLGIAAALGRRQPGLAVWALAMPIYWLLISAAGYRAILQLVRNPFLWEKTQHGQS